MLINQWRVYGGGCRHSPSNKVAHILPIIGLGIVLFGFVAKDVERDRFKEISDALHAAQGSYEFQTQNRELVNLLKESHRSDDQSVKRNATQAELAETQQAVMTASQGLHRSLSDTKILIDALPESNMKARYKMISDEMTKAESHQMPTDLSNPKESIKHLDAALMELGPICLDSEQLSKEVIAMAEENRENAESSYKIWTVISYVAFGLGWLVALLGKIFGADVEVPGR
jgi:hypothetical protein